MQTLESYDPGFYPVAEATDSVRATFIRKTYGHLAMAVLAFVALEALLLSVVPTELILARQNSKGLMLVSVLGFVGVSWLANYWAQSQTSRALQYAGLGLYVAAIAVLFMPILFVANRYFPGAITTAGTLTLAVFGGLTLAVLLTRNDFSFMRTALCLGSFLTIGIVVAAILFSFPLGLWFSIAMVALACGFILYETSNVLHHYNPEQYVAASLALFASLAMLFYHILRIVMLSRR